MVMSDVERKVAERVAPIMEPYLRRMYGQAQQCEWACEDGWVVIYTTTRVEGGPHHGKFLTMTYKPTGPGARKGKATEWVRNYCRPFSTRKAAKARAVALYYQHSPKAAVRHGVKNP